MQPISCNEEFAVAMASCEQAFGKKTNRSWVLTTQALLVLSQYKQPVL